MKKTILLGIWSIIILLLSSISFADTATGLVSYYTFDGGSLLDSISGNHLSVVGGAPEAWDNVSCAVNGCYFFDGTDDKMSNTSMKALPTGATAKTLCSWFYSGKVVVGHSGAYGIGETAASGQTFNFGSDHENDWGCMNYDINPGDYFNPVLETKYFVCTIFEGGTSTKVYVDGVLNQTIVKGFAFVNTNLFVGRFAYGDQYARVMVDELTVYNRSLTADDVLELYTNDGNPIPSAVPASNLEIYNSTNENISVREGQLFYFKGNYTLNGVLNTTAQCNISTKNLSATFLSGQTTNLTLTTGTQATIIVEENPTGILHDVIDFRVCHIDGIKYPVQIFVNGSLHREINKNLIPLCTAGSHSGLNITTIYNAITSLNVTVKCSDCSGGNTVRLIAQDNTETGGNTLSFRRVFSTYNEDLTYNASSYYYEYNDHYMSFFDTGVHIFNMTCGGYSKTRSYTVAGVNPLALLLEITDVNGEKTFTTGISIESGNITVLGSCSGDVITLSRMNLTYANGTLISTSTNKYNEYLSSVMNLDGIYNVSLTCRDDEGVQSIVRKYFTVNDTVVPNAVWVSPLFDNSTEITENSTLSIDITAIDTNLFDINITCVDSLGVVKGYFYYDNISSPYQLQNVTETITNTGTGECTLIVKDRHTLSSISDIDLKPTKEDKAMTFKYQGAVINISTIEDVTDFKIEKIKDRYTFEPIISKIPADFVYYVDCSGSYLWDFYDKEFGHYMNCGDLWIDFDTEGVNKDDIRFKRISSERIRVEIPTKDAISLKTKSIGVKNTLTETVSFEVNEAAAAETTADSDVGTSMIFLGVILLWLGIMFAGFLFGLPELLLFDGLLGIIIGVAIIMTSISMATTIGIIFALFNSVMMVSGIYAAR